MVKPRIKSDSLNTCTAISGYAAVLLGTIVTVGRYTTHATMARTRFRADADQLKA